jgi:hypothetical protein
MKQINDLVSGKLSNGAGLWAMTNKQASGSGHTLSASACFRIQAHQNMQSLLGFDFIINKHPGLIAHLKCIHLSAHYRFIKLELDVAPCVGVTASEDDSAHGLMMGGPIIEVWH